MNLIPFPGAATDPAPEPQKPASVDPVALFEDLGRSLINTVGDRTVGEALEQLARMPAEAVLRDIFGLNKDQGT